MSCYCGEVADVWQATPRTARNRHQCEDCNREIQAGERYEEIRILFDGLWTRYRVCAHCKAVREALESRLPCYCYMVGGLYEELRDYLADLRAAETGDSVAVLRLIAAGRKAARETRRAA